jgi:putative nucleotidyltransferase-like protein
VEVHWRLFPNARLMPVDPDWLSRPRHVEIQGAQVPAVPLSAQWLYLLAHGSNHPWSRMKWLADVPAFALRHPRFAQPDALEAAGTGYRRSIATGLLVAEATFGRFLTPEARTWAACAGGTRTLVRQSLGALRADHDRPTRVMPRAMLGEVIGRLALRRDARYRLDELRVLLLSAGRVHGVEDPGLVEIARGPLSWTRRSARRLARRDTT